jgi:transposase
MGGCFLIQITPQMRIMVAIESIDGRKGIDSIAQLCREKLAADPFSGCLFIFRNRSGKSIRILAYDEQGFWLATKRLSKGRFKVVANRRGWAITLQMSEVNSRAPKKKPAGRYWRLRAAGVWSPKFSASLRPQGSANTLIIWSAPSILRRRIR